MVNSITLSQMNAPTIPLERTLGMPPEGPKCLPVSLDFSISLSYELDYSNMQSRAFLSMVQTLWVDNSLSAQPLDITSPQVGQVLKIPAGIQGYFTVICPNPIRLIFASTGGVLCVVILLNFPVLG